jgi:hypothetical protein
MSQDSHNEINPDNNIRFTPGTDFPVYGLEISLLSLSLARHEGNSAYIPSGKYPWKESIISSGNLLYARITLLALNV